jgi:hypothetical protein
MRRTRSARVERIGVMGVGMVVERDLDWVYREQPVEDYGIDAHLEVVENDETVTGQLIAVQVRSRERPFDRIEGGWIVRDSLEHLDYWMGHVLPVILVVYDTHSERAYWQRVSRHTVVPTGSGFKIEVPESQPLDATARSALREIAARADDRALQRFEVMCGYLPTPCAEALQKAHAGDPMTAARLAALLAEGRAQPSLTAQSVLAAPPRGMTDSSWRLWQALGAYAAEHEFRTAAAAAFERAAAYADADARPRLLGLAACLLAATALATGDEETVAEARRLVGDVRDADRSSLLADLAEAVIGAAQRDDERSWIPRPWELPHSVKSLSDEDLSRDAMLSIAVGDDALIRGDVEAAVTRYEAAVAALPTSPGPKMKLAHALVRRATEGSQLAAVDYEDAERLAREALAEQRRWAGPSEHASELLLRILFARSSFTEAVEQARLDPAGKALPREAAHEGVRFLGARAAVALGKLGVADNLAAGITHPLTAAQFTAWRSEADGDAATRRQAWERVAELAAESRDLTAMLVASHRLAAAGVWPIAGLDNASTAGVLPANLISILAAVADASAGNVDSAIASLRPMEDTEILAVEHQAKILEDADRVDEAVEVCLAGAQRFQAPHLRFMASEALAGAGRADEAAALLVGLLASGVGSPDARRSIRLKLIEHGYARSDWAAVEGHAFAELGAASRTEVPPIGRPADETDQFAWALIGARFNYRDLDGAAAAWRRYKPAIASPRHAEAWLQLQRAGAWRAEDIGVALAIAEQWPGEEQLVSHVVATVLLETAGDDGGRRLGLTDVLAARLAAVQARYHADYPDGALQMVEFDVDRFVEDIAARLESVARISADLEGMVRDHRLPVGVYASTFHRPYALAVLTRPAGITPAGTPFENDYDRELQAASRALDRGLAVCETSALYLSVLLDEHWAAIRGRFHRLLLPLVSYDDILRTVDELVVPASGTMDYDPHAGRLVLHEPTPETTSLLRERAAALEARARTLTRIPVGELTALPLQDAVHDAAWLASIQLAADTGNALYSDDVALRELAHAVGVEAFGTLALVHTLINRRQIDDITELVLRKLVPEYVVDLPVPLEVLIDIAAADGWVSGPAMTIVTRPRWWADTRDAAQDFLDIARRVATEEPQALRQWVYAAAVGAGGSNAPETKSNAIAMVATLVVAQVTGLSDSLFADVVTAARDAARSIGCDEPTARMVAAMCAVAADLSGRDPDDEIVRSEVEQAFAEVATR